VAVDGWLLDTSAAARSPVPGVRDGMRALAGMLFI
jgi:hypothetical protein